MLDRIFRRLMNRRSASSSLPPSLRAKTLRLESLERRELLTGAGGIDFTDTAYEFVPNPGEAGLPLSAPGFVELIDVDGDLDDDLVFIDSDGMLNLSIHGDSGFGAATPQFFTGEPTYTEYVVGDFTGEGIPDLVVAQPSPVLGVSLKVYQGMVDGGGFSFSSTPNVTDLPPALFTPDGGLPPANVSPQDLFVAGEGTGKLGLVVQSLTLAAPPVLENLHFELMWGAEGFDPTLTPLDQVANGIAHAAGDLDGSGATDYVSVEAPLVGDHILYLYTQAQGESAYAETSFTLPYEACWHSTTVEDLDGDGQDDVLVGLSDGTNYSVGIWFSDATPGNEFVTYPVSTEPNLIAVGDVLGDSGKEILIADSLANFAILKNVAGQYVEQPPVLADVDYLATATADVNGDGVLDLLAASPNALTVRYGQGAGQFGDESAMFALPQQIADAEFADVTGDGELELVIAWNGDDPEIQVYQWSGGAVGLLASTPVQYGITEFAMVDLDSDGAEDDIVALNYNREIFLLTHDTAGAYNTPQEIDPGLTNPVVVDAGQIDGQLGTDIVVIDGETGQAVILYSQAGGAYASYSAGSVASGDIVGTDNGVSDVELADVNGNGLLDIVAAVTAEGNVTVMYNQGDSTFAGKRTISVGGDPSDVAVADLNYDGHQDIAVSRAEGQKVAVIFGQDDTDPFLPVEYFGTSATSAPPVGLTLAMADDNGSTDILIADNNTVYVLLNTHQGVLPGDAGMVAVVRAGDSPMPPGSGENDLPTSLTKLHEWIPVVIEVWGTSGGSTGIDAFSATLSLDTDLFGFDVTDIVPGPGFESLSANITSSQVVLSGGSPTLNSLGDTQYVLLARINATGAPGVMGGSEGVANVSISGQYPAAVNDPITLSGGTLTLVGDGTVGAQLTSPSGLEIHAVPYDTDDDGEVGRLDYMGLRNNYDRQLTGTAADSALAIYDYNRDGAIDRLDYMAFRNNYNTSWDGNTNVTFTGAHPLAGVAFTSFSTAPYSASFSTGGDDAAAHDLVFGSYDQWS